MSYNPTKCDPALGKQIEKYLVEKGVHTPTSHNGLAIQEKIDIIEDRFRDIMVTLGLDMTDDSLTDTPTRVAKMYVKEVFWGLDPNAFPKCTAVQNKMQYDEMVVEKCTIMSGCEHHLVYFGTAHNPRELGCWIAYIPKDKVIGLSKLSRVAEYFSRRPQIQERLTEQIYHALSYILGTDDVAVVIKAQHFCVLTRGVEDPNSFTITSKLGGEFMSDPNTRSEFMALARRS